MAVIRSIPLQQYTPQTLTTDFNIPASVRSLIVTFSCVGWPAGPCAILNLTQPNGDHGGGATFHGNVEDVKNGGLLTSVSYSFLLPVNRALRVGRWDVSLQILQTINTAITVERF